MTKKPTPYEAYYVENPMSETKERFECKTWLIACRRASALSKKAYFLPGFGMHPGQVTAERYDKSKMCPRWGSSPIQEITYLDGKVME